MVGFRTRLLAPALASLLIVTCVSGDESGSNNDTRGEVDDMAFEPMTPAGTLGGYLAVDEKYFIAPLPVHLSREVVEARVAGELARPDRERLRRVARLAVFYDLRDSARAFLELAEPVGGDPPETSVAALGVQTVGWLGDSDEKTRARESLERLLSQTPPDRPARASFLPVFRAWGPELDLAALERWVDAGIADLEVSLKRERTDGDVARVELLEDEIDELAAFKRSEVRGTAEENRTRAEVAALEPRDRTPRLARLYLLDSPGSSPEISYWAAISLVRLRAAGLSSAPDIAGAFLAQSHDFHAAVPIGPEEAEDEEEVFANVGETEPLDVDASDAMDADELAEEQEEARRAADDRYGEDDPQREADLGRTSCLRAAVFFGAVLGEEETAWLAAQEDPGTDLLALRPHWEY